MKTVAALALLLPLNASADVVLVEYWGSVYWAYDGVAAVGDMVAGSMRLDTSGLPADRDSDSRIWNYAYNNLGCEVDCVRAQSKSFVDAGTGVSGTSDDHAWLIDGDDGDLWGLEDTEYGLDFSAFTRLELSAPVDLISSWHEPFELDVKGSGGTGYLTVSALINGAKRFYGATLDRVNVSIIRSCRAT